jgi:DNA-binding transcriptional ArsR family regulator
LCRYPAPAAQTPHARREVAKAFAMTKGSLSHHFNILKQAGLVRCERRGQFQVYSLNTSVFEETMATLMELFGADKRKKS